MQSTDQQYRNIEYSYKMLHIYRLYLHSIYVHARVCLKIRYSFFPPTTMVVFFFTQNGHIGGESSFETNPNMHHLYTYYNILGGGFKYFLFSPLFGEMIQFD